MAALVTHRRQQGLLRCELATNSRWGRDPGGLEGHDVVPSVLLQAQCEDSRGWRGAEPEPRGTVTSRSWGRGGRKGFSPLLPWAGRLPCCHLDFRASDPWNCRRMHGLCSKLLSVFICYKYKLICINHTNNSNLFVLIPAAVGSSCSQIPSRPGMEPGLGTSLRQCGRGRRVGDDDGRCPFSADPHEAGSRRAELGWLLQNGPRQLLGQDTTCGPRSPFPDGRFIWAAQDPLRQAFPPPCSGLPASLGALCMALSFPAPTGRCRDTRIGPGACGQ